MEGRFKNTGQNRLLKAQQEVNNRNATLCQLVWSALRVIC